MENYTNFIKGEMNNENAEKQTLRDYFDGSWFSTGIPDERSDRTGVSGVFCSSDVLRKRKLDLLKG